MGRLQARERTGNVFSCAEAKEMKWLKLYSLQVDASLENIMNTIPVFRLAFSNAMTADG